MKFVDDWKWIVRYGWQWRLNILAAILSGLEFAVSFVDPNNLPSWLPRGRFAGLAVVIIILANFFRLFAQQRPPKVDNADQ